MRYHRLFFLLLFCFWGLNTFADTFVVTSNADSGPGTLRDALTQAAANGTAVKDYISFNIADQSVTGTTITLLSQLPNVTSNLVIDGTTQPGNFLGVSNAKISITADNTVYRAPYDNYTNAGAFIITNASNIELYGLYVYKFHDIWSSVNISGMVINSAVIITNSSNITIGAPGKGNVFAGNDYCITSNNSPNYVNSQITIKSNFLGLMPDGKSNLSMSDLLPFGFFLSGNDITIGGDNPGESNYICYLDQIETFSSLGGNNLQLVNNQNNIDYFGNSIKSTSSFYIYGTNIIVRNNTSTALSLHISYSTGFNIYANVDKYASLSYYPSVYTEYSKNGVIGSDDISKINVFQCSDMNGAVNNYGSTNIQVLKNSIVCSPYPYFIQEPSAAVPSIKVLVNNDTEYSGTATPNSIVYIYQDNTDCPVCSPVTFYTNVTADATGAWKITGNFANLKWIANTLLLQNSSEFTNPGFSSAYGDQFTINPSCGRSNGSIGVLNVKNALVVKWYDANDNEVGQGTTITGLGPGQYYARAFNGHCSTKSQPITLYNTQIFFIDNNKKITPPSCGKGGSITGIIPVTNNDPETIVWTDQNNNVVGNTSDISGLNPGSYTLTVTDTRLNCTIVYGPVVIAAPSNILSIDQSTMAVQSTPCGQSIGSIKGITASGNGPISYVWKNAAGQQVSTNADLSNQPAGSYTLQVNDGTTCGPISSAAITIPETNGITMDESGVKTTITSCGLSNGTITGIQVAGATQYQWTDASNKVVANTLDFTSAIAGDYTLTASNTYGCVKASKSYHVGQQVLTTYPQYASVITNACYGQSNGSISVVTDALVKSARWVYNGGTFSNAAAISNLTAGAYQLYLTDANGCEQLYNSYSVTTAAQLQIVQGSGTVVDDGCSLKTGSVTGVQATGGFPPYTYSWTNQVGKIVSPAMDLTGVGAGIYTVGITDSRSCALVTADYKVQNQDNVIAPPSVSNVQICAPGNVTISVNSPQSGLTYKLYDSETTTDPIDQQTDGRFIINAKATGTFYVSRVIGSCESSRIAVTVSVGISAADIPNTITPNADGINDYWKIPGIENYPQAMVRIYNRSGQQVFESRGYTTAFNGTYNGKLLPYGAYYYIIELSGSCNLLRGSITIVR